MAERPKDVPTDVAAGAQFRSMSCRPALQVAAVTKTGRRFVLPLTRVAMQYGKQEVPTAATLHMAPGSSAHLGTSQMVASTTSHVPRVMQLMVGAAGALGTTSAITVPAWYSITAGTVGSTPGATEAFTVVPNMWDHKVFTAINVVSGDSIQFTYSLLINSGG